MSGKYWTVDEVGQLRELAATGAYASEAAQIFGVTRHSIITIAGRNDISIARHTPEEAAEMRATARACELRKHEARKRARRANGYVPPEPKRASIVKVTPGTSQSSPVYRRQLPPIGEMSKDRMREMIAQAVRNTAEMQINA